MNLKKKFEKLSLVSKDKIEKCLCEILDFLQENKEQDEGVNLLLNIQEETLVLLHSLLRSFKAKV